ncbi:MAG: CPBP family intramembrane metalloprotease [Muribaculaceae bacterium]|nr:CPBP family intramembrane metalloprotease [Muribaculaceae bacterium]
MMLFQSLLSVIFMGIKAAQGIKDEALITAFATENILGEVLISNLLIGLVFFCIYRFRKLSIVKEWRLYPFSWKEVCIASGITLAYSILYAYMVRISGVTEPDVIARSAEYYLSLFPGCGLIMMCLNLLVMAPLIEEIVFRGVIYNQIVRTTNPVIAIVGSGLLFGLIHIMAGGWLLTAGAFIMGILLSYIYYKTESLWVCILAHSVANLPDIYSFIMS